ncbi:MAG: hypothetical protein LBF77_05540, partial [Spirochaetaceae bacterium]|nr:hypothetical protein [Spirochaetaceae bacterium]
MKKLTVIIIVFFAAAGLVLVPPLLARFNGPASGGPGGGPGGAGAAGTVFAVRTGDAVVRSLAAYIEVNGNIVNEEQV